MNPRKLRSRRPWPLLAALALIFLAAPCRARVVEYNFTFDLKQSGTYWYHSHQ